MGRWQAAAARARAGDAPAGRVSGLHAFRAAAASSGAQAQRTLANPKAAFSNVRAYTFVSDSAASALRSGAPAASTRTPRRMFSACCFRSCSAERPVMTGGPFA